MSKKKSHTKELRAVQVAAVPELLPGAHEPLALLVVAVAKLLPLGASLAYDRPAIPAMELVVLSKNHALSVVVQAA